MKNESLATVGPITRTIACHSSVGDPLLPNHDYIAAVTCRAWKLADAHFAAQGLERGASRLNQPSMRFEPV